MKCLYCKKELDGKRCVTTYSNGKQTATFCDPECMCKAAKKITRVIKKMGREEFLSLMEKMKKEGKGERRKKNNS